MATSEDIAADQERHGKRPWESRFTYDDTGADVVISASNGWKIQRVIEEGYKALGEQPRPGDRVEANGQSMQPYLDQDVKEYVERGLSREFSVASNIGGATR